MAVDMTIEELKKYKGTNPKPEDYDEYWERALRELEETKKNIEITKYGFENPIADCYELYFDGVRGGRIFSKLLVPKNIKKKCPAILHFHGYGGKSLPWSSYLGFVASGFVVAAMDCRGQTGKSDDFNGYKGNSMWGHMVTGLKGNPDNLKYRQIYLDAASLAKTVMELEYVDDMRVGAYGSSQGGALTIACAGLEPRIKIICPQSPYLCDFKRNIDKNNMPDQLAHFFRENDPEHKNEDEIFKKLGYIDIQFMAERVKAKVSMHTGLLDITCLPSTQFAAYNKIKSEKTINLYHDFGHEMFPDIDDVVYNLMMNL